MPSVHGPRRIAKGENGGRQARGWACREGSLALVAVSSVPTQSLRYIATPLHQLTDVHVPKAAGQKVQVAILDQLFGKEGYKVVLFRRVPIGILILGLCGGLLRGCRRRPNRLSYPRE